MDFKDMATKMLMSKLGGNADEGAASSALEQLLGGSEGSSPLAGLVEKFSGGDLGAAAQSWLGDGDNETVNAEQVSSALGSEQVADFASKLGIDPGAAAESLSNFLPDLIDKSSSGGNLMDSLGDVGNIAGMASKFFK